MTAINRTWKFLAVVGLSLGLAATGLVAAEKAAHKPDHDHAAAPAKLTLDEGRKWATDEPLRKGMENIRHAVDARLHDIHEGKLGAAGYGALASKVNGEVSNIVSNCKLEPKADAQLHLVIADILQGVEAMKGKTTKAKREKGAEKVVRALDSYGTYFDHPGWEPIRH